MLSCVVGWAVPNILKDCSLNMSRVKLSKKTLWSFEMLLGPEEAALQSFKLFPQWQVSHPRILQFSILITGHHHGSMRMFCALRNFHTKRRDNVMAVWYSVTTFRKKQRAVNYEGWFLINDQRDAQIPFYVFIFIYNSLHVSSTLCSSSGETDCVNTSSDSCHSVLVAVSCAPAHGTTTNTEWQLPEVVLTQFVSPDDEHNVLENVESYK